MPSAGTRSGAFWAGVVFFILVLLTFSVASISVYRWLHDAQQLPVQDIVFQGEKKHINTQRLEQLVRTSQPGSFFELDVNEVYELLQQQPWVYRASVLKQWPNRLPSFQV